MKTEIIVLNISHYDMGDNRGVSARIFGDVTQTNNKFGLEVSDAAILDYGELRNLKNISYNEFPAKFKAEIVLTSIKAANGKEKTGIGLKNLEYMNSVEFVDKKTPVKM